VLACYCKKLTRKGAEQDKEAADFKAKLEKVKKEKDDVKKREASRKEELQVHAAEVAHIGIRMPAYIGEAAHIGIRMPAYIGEAAHIGVRMLQVHAREAAAVLDLLV